MMKKTADPELIQNLVKYFSKLDRRQKHFMREALKASGVYGIMYKLIITIKKHPGTSQDFLAEFHSVDKSHITRRVRELEKMGYLSRSVNEDDRRFYRLFLTEKGEELFSTIRRALAEWGNTIAEDIPARDISVTMNTIERMITNAG